MDVRQYFEPVDFSMFSKNDNYSWKYTLGKVIEKSTFSFVPANAGKVKVAMFGVPSNNGNYCEGANNPPNQIRAALYALSSGNFQTKIVDLGNLKKANTQKGTYLAIRDVIEYFNELNIVTIIIGGTQDLTIGIADAYKNNPFFSLTVIDAILDVKKGREISGSSNFLSRIFTNNTALFQFNLLAYQIHLFSNQLFLKTIGLSQHLRLGLLKENLKRAEPVFRNTDVVSFDFKSLKSSESPNNKQLNPNGLFSDEACELAKYAGFSNRVKTFGIFELGCSENVDETSKKLAAEIIWYFIEGYVNRTADNFQTTGKTKYKVEISGLDQPIVFYKCKTTNRWWLEILTTTHQKLFIACSKKDYRQAASNEVPEIWLKFVQKTDEFLK